MEPCFGSVFFVHAQLENVHGYAWFVGGKRWCWGRAGGTGRLARVGCGGGGAKPFRVTFASAPRALFWSHGCDVALHAFHGRVRHQKRSRATQPAPAGRVRSPFSLAYGCLPLAPRKHGNAPGVAGRTTFSPTLLSLYSIDERSIGGRPRTSVTNTRPSQATVV